MKERILGFLAQGVKAAEVATIVGCSPSYISQLLKDQTFLEELSEAVANQPKKSEEEHISQKYELAEHKILNSIMNGLDDAKLSEKVRALEVVARRQMEVRKLNILPALAKASAPQIVNLQLPAIFQQQMAPVIEMNTESEVISIGGKALAPLPGEGVKNLFAALKERKELAEAGRTLENGVQNEVARVLEIPSDF